MLWQGVWFLACRSKLEIPEKPTKAGMESANQIHVQLLASCTLMRAKCSSTKPTLLATGCCSRMCILIYMSGRGGIWLGRGDKLMGRVAFVGWIFSLVAFPPQSKHLITTCNSTIPLRQIKISLPITTVKNCHNCVKGRFIQYGVS